jgi:hypothetical protein
LGGWRVAFASLDFALLGYANWILKEFSAFECLRFCVTDKFREERMVVMVDVDVDLRQRKSASNGEKLEKEQFTNVILAITFSTLQQL